MRINLIIIACAVLGLLLCSYIIYRGNRKPIYTEIVPALLTSPYKNFIACQGIIESRYKNISIGSSFSDLITDVYIFVGDHVPKGTPLFKTDSRKLEAQLQESLQDSELAQQDYCLQSKLFEFYQELTDKSAVSKQAYTQAEYNKTLSLKRLEKARATVNVIKTDLQRCIVRAPISGEVLQVNIRPGQYALQTSTDDSPLILFGDTRYYHLRIDIDEEDCWRFKKDAPGYAYIRGNNLIKIPIEYVYTEPYIIPKRSLTGSDQERTDTRVLQVVYRFKKNDFPVYIGQLLDVYIESIPHEVA